MTVFVEQRRDRVVLRARVEDALLDVLGDLCVEVRPGEEALGRTYEQWASGPARVELDGPAAAP